MWNPLSELMDWNGALAPLARRPVPPPVARPRVPVQPRPAPPPAPGVLAPLWPENRVTDPGYREQHDWRNNWFRGRTMRSY